MSGDLVAGSFARSALRLSTLIEGSAVRVARKKFNSVRKVLGEDHKLFSRFEKGPDNELLCTFGSEQGLLLAEIVRDWMAQDGFTADTFLWCERLEEEYALVCVMEGRIVKETFESAGAIKAEAACLVSRLRAQGSDFCIFLHDLDAAKLGLDKDLPVRRLKTSVQDYARQTAGELPQLLSFQRAIAQITSRWRVRAILMAGVLAVALVIPGTWAVVNWWLGGPPDIDFASMEQYRALVEEYHDLLRSPDPGVLLPAIHRVSLKFFLDSQFGKQWIIRSLEWNRDAGWLKISASLPDAWGQGSPDEGLPSDLQQQIRAEVESRGWKVKLSGTDGIFMLPVLVDGRTEQEVNRLRIAWPEKAQTSWDLAGMADDMKLVGELLPTPEKDRVTEVYRAEAVVLRLSSDPWIKGGTAKWIGKRLAGAPLVLDSVTLRTPPSGSGGFLNGEIAFRSVWRIPRAGADSGQSDSPPD